MGIANGVPPVHPQLSAWYTHTMPSFYTDTDPNIEAIQVQLLRDAPAWRKMEILAGLSNSARAIAMAGLHQRYPNAGEVELRRRLADLLLGQDLARKVFGEVDENA